MYLVLSSFFWVGGVTVFLLISIEIKLITTLSRAKLSENDELHL